MKKGTFVDWPQKALNCLKKSSKVELEGENIDNLGRLGQLKMMRSLNISYVQIQTLQGLKLQENLETLIADGSSIISFANFSSVPNLRCLSMLNTPVSKEPTFLLTALIICPKLTTVNGKIIPKSIINKSIKSPSAMRKLIDKGMMAEYPYPSSDDLQDLCSRYGILTDEQQSTISSQLNEEPSEDDFEDVLAELYRQQEQIVQNARMSIDNNSQLTESETEVESEHSEELLEIESTDESDFGTEAVEEATPLVDRIADVLSANGFEIDQNDVYTSVLNTIKELVKEDMDL
ncbi:hypothetical protein GPJ56_004301 [Histomonas meleagridis]|uniref:uncharacterized protein n=1 Tax=Histomonas meleagridis TaxID=135588 RepID=UPI00355A4E1F|nr:hypothetical protein GPJ56_004301 [Histomonas meleagridis]KAH0800484.1 hypothetical protein GO595_006687 [Histomonas meleagridis]